MLVETIELSPFIVYYVHAELYSFEGTKQDKILSQR